MAQRTAMPTASRTRRTSTPIDERRAVRGRRATRRTASAASDAGRTVASTAVDEGQEVASTALDKGQEVASTVASGGQEIARRAVGDARGLAGTVKDQAGEVGDELRQQGQQLWSETSSQLQTQAEAQAERLASALRRYGNEAGALASGRPEEAETLSPLVRRAAEALDRCADEIELRGVAGLAEDLEGFARRQPTVFLVAAAAAGFALGRMVRAGKEGEPADLDDDTASNGQVKRATATAAARPPVQAAGAR